MLFGYTSQMVNHLALARGEVVYPFPLYRTPDPHATPGEGTSPGGCIVRRLRQTRANMIGTDDEQHYFDCHEAAAEIERLRQWGRLTDEERQAVRWFSDYGDLQSEARRAEVLRSLLARLA